MADFTFRISPNIILGSYTTARLGQYVREWGSKFMLIMDPVLKDYDIAEKIQKSLSDRKIEFFVFDNISGSLDTEICKKGLELAKSSHIHGIIAAGGPHTANIARVIASLYNESNDLYDYIDGASPTSAPLPLITVPTMISDPFMFTDRTPITDARARQIKLLKLQPNLTKLTVYDSNMIVNLTENQLASMSLQALCLSIEAYVSQKANFFSDTILEKSIELLSYGISGAPSINNSASSEILLTQGGCMSSLGAALSSMGPASLLGLTNHGRYGVQRSITTTILFPYFIEECQKYKTEKLSRVAQIMRITSAGTNPETAVTALVDSLRSKMAMANLPARLKDTGISIEDLALIADDAGQLELINGLPRSMSADDLFDFIKQAY